MADVPKSEQAALQVAYLKRELSEKIMKLNELIMDFGDGESKDFGHVGTLRHVDIQISSLLQFVEKQ